jgi:hypothetical protein
VLAQGGAVVVVAGRVDERGAEAGGDGLDDRAQAAVLRGAAVLGQIAGEDERGRADRGVLDGAQRVREDPGGVDTAGELLAVGHDVQVGELDERVGGGGMRHTDHPAAADA